MTQYKYLVKCADCSQGMQYESERPLTIDELEDLALDFTCDDCLRALKY